jgi:hypothetical protein
MRFIAFVTMISGFMTLFFVLMSMVVFSFVPLPPSIQFSTTGQGAATTYVYLNPNYLLAGALAALVISAVNVYLGYVLLGAAEDFDRVARTDEADQALLAQGLDRLKLYFQVIVVVAVLSLLAGVVIAMAFLARSGGA